MAVVQEKHKKINGVLSSFSAIKALTSSILNDEFGNSKVRKLVELIKGIATKNLKILADMKAVFGRRSKNPSKGDLKLTRDYLEDFIISTLAFKEPGLTLSKLSALTGVPNHKLSELLGRGNRFGFNGYINKLRIGYVVERIALGDDEKYTLEAISRDAGFSSRNTFHTSFKKTMLMNPSEYLSLVKSERNKPG